MILDDSNIAENYPGVCSPLTCSVAEESYRLVFTRLAERFLGGTAGVEDMVGAMAVAYRGHLYYRLDNWLRTLRILPFARWIVPMWRRSLGVPVAALPPRPPIGWWRRAGVLVRLVGVWIATPRLMTRLDQEFTATQQAFDAEFTGSGDPDPVTRIAALRVVFERLRTRVLRDWDITLVNDLRAFLYTDLATRTGAPVHGVTLESLKPVRALAELRSLPGRAELAALTTNAAVEAYLAGNSPLAEALRAYLDRYGDRGPGELKLESETFRTNPLALVHAVLATPLGAARTADLAPARFRNPLARRALQAVANRETSRLHRSRLYGMIRTIAREVGALLAAHGYLDDASDVFFLTWEEMLSAPVDRRDAVASRRQTWAEYATLPIESRVVLGEPAAPAASRSVAKPGRSDRLQGIPAAAGRAEGDVLVVAEPGVDASGRIVVTVSTDPGWVFLLSTAAGVIAERGSPLSHTAIVCRELGLPAIVGVPDATSRLRTGDRVRLDADTGAIEVIAHAF